MTTRKKKFRFRFRLQNNNVFVTQHHNFVTSKHFEHFYIMWSMKLSSVQKKEKKRGNECNEYRTIICVSFLSLYTCDYTSKRRKKMRIDVTINTAIILGHHEHYNKNNFYCSQKSKIKNQIFKMGTISRSFSYYFESDKQKFVG